MKIMIMLTKEFLRRYHKGYNLNDHTLSPVQKEKNGKSIPEREETAITAPK